MQLVSNPLLLNALVDVLPLDFLDDLGRSVSAMYREVKAEVEANPALEGPEAEYLLPHTRRAYFEANFRRVAALYGLQAAVKSNRRETAKFGVVTAGNIIFTASHVSSPGAPVRSAAFRSERSELNDLLDQEDFFGFEEVTDDADGVPPIYCILLYGELRSAISEAPFIQFAFPSPDSAAYVDLYTLDEVIVAARARTRVSSTKVEDRAFPTPKTQPKVGTDDDEAAQ